VRDAGSDKGRTTTSAVSLHSPMVDIQELRETERLFHQSQGVIERPQVVQQRRVYAVATRRIPPQRIRRATDNLRDKHQRSPSRPR